MQQLVERLELPVLVSGNSMSLFGSDIISVLAALSGRFMDKNMDVFILEVEKYSGRLNDLFVKHFSRKDA